MNLSLFAPDEPPLKAKLAPRLKRLAGEGVLIGASSWKYEGWLGEIYTPERYVTRGKHSHKKFEETCLTEYGEIFPVVCGDFSFYQFPTPAFWQRLFAAAPAGLSFAFKVPEEITVRQWPSHARYGARGGLRNSTYLDSQLFRASFTEALAPYAARVETLIFEFGTVARPQEPEFLAELEAFLASLPAGFRYAVEIRNPEFFTSDYLALLTRHQVAHVLNSWTRMPELAAQASMPGVLTTDFFVVRALLRPGRAYEEAVQRFSPYTHVQEENASVRQTLRELIAGAKKSGRRGLIFVNNRLEGNAPGTIDAVLDET
ncbi:MAG: DUF72 domain-containing protein [Bryobacteraceae bacterium]|nr:DUF72 domain-containing protein [Bryobacteraceae bacterium]